MSPHTSDVLTVESVASYNGYPVPYSFTTAPGEEPPLVLLGGAFQTADSWRPFQRRLRGRKPLLIIDLPGAPGNGVLPSRYDCRWLTGSVPLVLDELGIEVADVLAFSYATPVGFCFGSMHPDRIRRLALGGCDDQFAVPGTPSERVIRIAAEYAEARDAHGFAAYVLNVALLNRNPSVRIARHGAIHRAVWKQLTSMTSEHLEAFVENSDRLLQIPSYVPAMPRPSCPSIGFTGEYDHFTTAKGCRSLMAGFDDAIFTTITGTDHLAIFEAQEQVVDLVDTFFTDDVPRQLDGCAAYEYSAARRQASSVLINR